MTTETAAEPIAPADAPAPDAAAPGKDAAPDASPSSEGAGNEPKTSLEALTQRLEQMRQQSDKPAEDKPAEAKADGEADDDVPGETAEEKTAFKGKDAETKIRTLTKDRRELRKEAARLDAELKALAPVRESAKKFDEFSGWVRSTGLSQEDVQQGLTIVALMRSDPFKALEVVAPIYAELQRRAGAVLPEDLQGEVDSGMVTEDRARELARLRQQNQHIDQRSQAQQQQFEAERQQQQITQLQSAKAAAVNAAEMEVMRNDPDYSKKKGLVATMVKSLWVDEGYPQSTEAAVAQYKKAVKLVNDDFASRMPRQSRPAASGAPNVSAGGEALPAPKSSLEAMQRAAQRGGIRITG